jgi:hypothetical protein
MIVSNDFLVAARDRSRVRDIQQTKNRVPWRAYCDKPRSRNELESNFEANQRHNISLVDLEPRQCRSHLRPN